MQPRRRHHRVKPQKPTETAAQFIWTHSACQQARPGPTPPQNSPGNPFALASPLVFADAAKMPFGPTGAPGPGFVMCKQTEEFPHKCSEALGVGKPSQSGWKRPSGGRMSRVASRTAIGRAWRRTNPR